MVEGLTRGVHPGSIPGSTWTSCSSIHARYGRTIFILASPHASGVSARSIGYVCMMARASRSWSVSLGAAELQDPTVNQSPMSRPRRRARRGAPRHNPG